MKVGIGLMEEFFDNNIYDSDGDGVPEDNNGDGMITDYLPKTMSQMIGISQEMMLMELMMEAKIMVILTTLELNF